jgi:hypothetical protein
MDIATSTKTASLTGDSDGELVTETLAYERMYVRISLEMKEKLPEDALPSSAFIVV